MSNNYPTIQIRIDQTTKDELFSLAKLRGTTPSAMLKAFIQEEVASYAREKRVAEARADSDLDFLG